MKGINLLRCAICERALLIGADDGKVFFVGCPTCNLLTPVSEVLSRVSEITYGNHLKGKGSKEAKVPAARRNGKPSKK